MSLEARRQYLGAIRERYEKARRTEKTRILDEFCAVCGYTRKYAIRVLRNQASARRMRPGPKARYGPEVVRHLAILWRAMNCICSKNFKAALPLWLPLYRGHELTPEIRRLLLRMSPATIDRLLAPERRAAQLRGISTTRAQKAWIRSKIPIELLNSKITEPGFVEADTVAHCGASGAGSFAHSLTLTDLFSAWTENRACLGKDALAVLEQIKSIERGLPFILKGFACDNGTEFLNESLHSHFTERNHRPIKFVRRRPYQKNDAAHVEQKNFTHVRQLFGYERIDNPDLVGLMNEIYREYWNPLQNFFIPTLKLKEKARVGSRIQKRYDPPETPCERLLKSEQVPNALKLRLAEHRQRLNPFTLKLKLDQKLKIFFELVDISKRSKKCLGTAA